MLLSVHSNIERRQYLENKLIENHLDLYKKYFNEPLTLLRQYDELLKEKDSYDRWVNEFKSSLEYKIGNLILLPFKIVKKIKKN